jgi:hypothetical protein
VGAAYAADPEEARLFRYPGHRPLDDRKVLSGILFVLATGIDWERSRAPGFLGGSDAGSVLRKEMLQRCRERGGTPMSCVSAPSVSASSRTGRSRALPAIWGSTGRRCGSECARRRRIRAAGEIC